MAQIDTDLESHTIIAAGTDGESHAERIIAALRASGVSEQNIGTALINPPGQHAAYSIGGDVDTDEGARDAAPNQRKGLAIGAAAGAAAGTVVGIAAAAAVPIVGAATVPLIAAVGAGVGAHVGGVMGTMQGLAKADTAQTGNDDSARHAEAESSANPVRRGGLMVAVCVAPEQASQVIALLRAHGAHDIERAQGQWHDRTWVDFDPVSTPQLV